MNTAVLVIGAVGSAVVGLGALLWAIGKHNARWTGGIERAWSEAATSLGLQRVDKLKERALAGKIDGFEVALESCASQKPDEPAVTRARLAGGGKISKELGFERGPARPDGPRLGDDEFDRAVRAQGPEDLLLAALSASARLAVQRWVSAGGTVREGDLAVELEYEHREPDLLVN